MKYILIIVLFFIGLVADDVKLLKTLNKILSNKEQSHKNEKINKVYIKNIKEDNITKKIQALIKKK